MEPITSWSEERVSAWLRGLDAPLQQYPVSEWHLSGEDLIQLTSRDLERRGVHKIGHQELVLEAVEKLCSLMYGLNGESLKSLTEKLRALAHTLQMGIQSRWRLQSYDGRSTTKLPVGVLQMVVELICSAKGLFSLLNRYQFFQLNKYTATKDIFTNCRELGEIVHKDTAVYEKEKDIISVCRQLVSVCDEILRSTPEGLLTHTAQLESVDLVPVSPGELLGIEITSTSSSSHYVSGTAVEPSAEASLKILAGDEVIKVNDQIVVGWSRANLVKKLRENPNGVSLVLKKIPSSKKRQNTNPKLKVSTPQKEEERTEETRSDHSDEEEEENNPRHSIFERVAASVRSLSFRRAIQGPEGGHPPMGQEESELPSDKGSERSLSLTSYHSQPGQLSPLSAQGDFEGREGSRSPRGASPQRSSQERTSVSSVSEMVGHTGNKDAKKSSTKGVTTAMSRRRVSCRELGRPDCDGWLWKKRKESGVFLTQKWQRFWFILKGPALYWYTSQQDEKAEGFVNISSYNIESAGEHKRKYVFKMFHPRFQKFFFAADHVGDMSKWINCLISAIQKHKKLHAGPNSEEECYSETESEGERSPSPGRKNKKVQSNTYPRQKGKSSKAPLPSPTAGGSKSTGPVDEMGQMLNNIKEGGVSLMGQEQPFTHDHFRRSFIKRNKNPIINEKAHTLRTLHSTLKAKEAELLQLNKLLDDSHFNASKFREWKELNEELYLDIEKVAKVKDSKAGHHKTQDTPSHEVAVETVPQAPAGVESEGAHRMNLSDGEQLVDVEPGDVILEHSKGPSSDTELSPGLDLNLGSLQESINQQLSVMAEGTGETESYFYI